MDLTRTRHVSRSVSVEGATGAEEARKAAVRLAERLQLGEPAIDRVAQIVTAAANNVIEHAKGGEILLRALVLEPLGGLEVIVLDKGPGIANVAEALRDGFSTVGSAGRGLGLIGRLSTFFEISSTVGKGTALVMRMGAVEASKGRLEWGVVCVPMAGEDACGDAWEVTAGPDGHTVLLVDGLGHGPLAFEAALQVVRSFDANTGQSPEARLRSMHETLRAGMSNAVSRGAVAAIAQVDWTSHQLRFAGAGNIAGTLVRVGERSNSLVSHSGTLGQTVTKFQEFAHVWPDRGLLVLSSDGLSHRWDLDLYPGLTQRDPSLIAGVLYRDFASRLDDVVVFVARERVQEATT